MADDTFMDFDTARDIVMERLRLRGFHPVVEAGPEHVEASKGKATRRYHVRWTDDGWIQFPEVQGNGDRATGLAGEVVRASERPSRVRRHRR